MSYYEVDPNPGEGELPTLKRILANGIGATVVPIGTDAGTAAAGDDSRIRPIQTAEIHGAPYGYTVEVDDTASLQAAITAAEAQDVPVVQINRTYRIATPSTLRIRKSAMKFYGVGPNAGLLFDFPAGDGLTVAPDATPTLGTDTGLKDVLLQDFFVRAAQPMTGGYGIKTMWTNSLRIAGLRFGRLDYTTRHNLYDALALPNQGDCVISESIFCAHRRARTWSGVDLGFTTLTGYNFGGMLTGKVQSVGDGGPGSIGDYIGGGTGGIILDNGNTSLWETGILVDNQITGTQNRELFHRVTFTVDTNYFMGIVIAEAGLAKYIGSPWLVGNGRQVARPGTAVPAGNGYGLYCAQTACELNITGAVCTDNGSDGICLNSGALLYAPGSNITRNGVNSPSSGDGGGSGVRNLFAQSEVILTGSNLSGNFKYGIYAPNGIGHLALSGADLTRNTAGDRSILNEATNASVKIRGCIGGADSAN